MTMKYLKRALIAFSLIAASPVHASEEALTWTTEAMMSTKHISDVQISPDNESILFVVTESKLSEEKGKFLSRIYRTTLDRGPLPFTSPDTSSMQPRWSPDGQWIAFVSTREGARNLYLINAAGGEATPLTKSERSVQTFAWSPDGQKIAFVMADEKESQEKTSVAQIYKQEKTLNRLWLLDVFSSESTPKPLTSDDYCVRGCGDFGTGNTDFDWSPDSQFITFAYSPDLGLDSFHLDSSLATLDILDGTVEPLEKYAPYEAVPRYSPDGHWIAYISSDSPERYSFDRQIAIRPSKDGKPRLLSQTYNEGVFIVGPSLLGWSQDGQGLLFFEPKRTKFHISLVPVDGTPSKDIETGETFFTAPALSPDRSLLGFVAQTPSTPPEAFIANLDEFVPIQLSAVNAPLLAYPEIKTELTTWTAEDGLTIEGFLTYPVDYEEGKRYPLLLVIHGGPMGFFSETYVGASYPYPIASFAQAGFMIFRPNPRGSCGYGKTFRCANYQDWGGGDFRDLMSGVDALIEKGLVDGERLGVMGWSYGGYMTAWTITQTTRFKAASMGAGLSNLVSMNGTTDLYRFLTDYLGRYSENRELYQDRSPIQHILNVETPCLIQHGTHDKRVPVSQSYEFYHALERLGKETELILYPEMGHHISDPKMHLDTMERNLAWFQHHLMNPDDETAKAR